MPLGDELNGTDVCTDEQWAAVEEARARWVFTAGMLELQAEDGSRLLLDADSGDFKTVRITLDTGRGDGAEEHVVEWPRRWYRALAADMRQMILSQAVSGGPVSANRARPACRAASHGCAADRPVRVARYSCKRSRRPNKICSKNQVPITDQCWTFHLY